MISFLQLFGILVGESRQAAEWKKKGRPAFARWFALWITHNILPLLLPRTSHSVHGLGQDCLFAALQSHTTFPDIDFGAKFCKHFDS